MTGLPGDKISLHKALLYNNVSKTILSQYNLSNVKKKKKKTQNPHMRRIVKFYNIGI